MSLHFNESRFTNELTLIKSGLFTFLFYFTFSPFWGKKNQKVIYELNTHVTTAFSRRLQSRKTELVGSKNKILNLNAIRICFLFIYTFFLFWKKK